jgi:hypothetical protein
MTVKRSSREGRWADLPSARVRFGIEAAFLLIVAGCALLANLGPAQILLSVFVAWVLVALIERASSRARSRPAEQQAAPAASVEPAREQELKPASPAAESLPQQPPPTPVVQQPAAQPAPREWNLWELERQAREHAGESARSEEWTALFVHLRQFASTEGLLPTEFDGLVRE